MTWGVTRWVKLVVWLSRRVPYSKSRWRWQAALARRIARLQTKWSQMEEWALATEQRRRARVAEDERRWAAIYRIEAMMKERRDAE